MVVCVCQLGAFEYTTGLGDELDSPVQCGFCVVGFGFMGHVVGYRLFSHARAFVACFWVCFAPTHSLRSVLLGLRVCVGVVWFGLRWCAILPHPGGWSTFAAAGLNFQVRKGGWVFPLCYDHRKDLFSPFYVFGGLRVSLYSGCLRLLVFVLRVCWV